MVSSSCGLCQREGNVGPICYRIKRLVIRVYRARITNPRKRWEVITPEKDGSSTTMRFTGKKIPDVPAAPDLSKLSYGKPVKLLNGKDLTGWKLLEEKKVSGWSFVDGVLVNDLAQKEGQPHIAYGNLCTVDKFEDFNLKLH